jgi:hypothetical protein
VTQSHMRTRWFDVLLAIAAVGSIVLAGSVDYVPTEEPAPLVDLSAQGCGLGPGPCGCDPVIPPCSMPCGGCCPNGCKPQDPPPTGAGE